jgi:ferric iron reductase protein FhuF
VSWLGATAVRWDAFEVGLDGVDWVRLTAALDPEWLAARIARLAEGGEHGPRPLAVAGSYFGSDLSWQIAAAAALVLHCDRRALDVSLDNLAVRIDDDGWPSRLAIVEERFACLPDDPAAGADGVTVVADRAALVAHLADAIVAAMEPVLRSVRALSRYGQPGLWGALADHVANVAWNLEAAGADAAELDAAWSTTEELLDALQARQRWLKVRPRRFRLDTEAGAVCLPMRGTCCLYYKAPESKVAEAAAAGSGLCTTCPLRADEERVALVEAHFAGGHAG